MGWKRRHGRRHSRRRLPNGFLDLTGTNFHHIPPQHPDRHPKFRGMRKTKKAHAAYHILYGAAGSPADAFLILWKDWWPNMTEADKARIIQLLSA